MGETVCACMFARMPACVWRVCVCCIHPHLCSYTVISDGHVAICSSINEGRHLGVRRLFIVDQHSPCRSRIG